MRVIILKKFKITRKMKEEGQRGTLKPLSFLVDVASKKKPENGMKFSALFLLLVKLVFIN